MWTARANRERTHLVIVLQRIAQAAVLIVWGLACAVIVGGICLFVGLVVFIVAGVSGALG
jgi:hypothetical protein